MRLSEEDKKCIKILYRNGLIYRHLNEKKKKHKKNKTKNKNKLKKEFKNIIKNNF